MVVLDVIHQIQAQEANDLAVRWNCKAGKCGSCSMEINGKPRLSCMTRMNTFAEDETITVQPLKTFPVIKDLVTDVSWNYAQNKRIKPFKPKPRRRRRQAPHVPGRRRPRAGVPEVHRVLPVPGRVPRAARPRRQGQVRRPALHDPPRRPRDEPARRRGSHPGDPQGVRLGLLQHHAVLHRGLPRAHQHHRQRHHPAQGARGGPLLRSGPDHRPQAVRHPQARLNNGRVTRPARSRRQSRRGPTHPRVAPLALRSTRACHAQPLLGARPRRDAARARLARPRASACAQR